MNCVRCKVGTAAIKQDHETLLCECCISVLTCHVKRMRVNMGLNIGGDELTSLGLYKKPLVAYNKTVRRYQRSGLRKLELAK